MSTIFGLNFFITDVRQFSQLLLNSQKKTAQLVLPVTANEIVQAQFSADFKKSLKKFAYLVTDGMPLVWLASLNHRQAGRVYGPKLMLTVLNQGQQRSTTHYFYGTTAEVLQKLKKKVLNLFPRAKIAGMYSPPFRKLSQKEKRLVIKKINQAHPDFLWLSLGGVKQAEWAAAMKSKLKARYIIPVGAAFDFISGHKPQAPDWVQKIGMEWFFRFLTEPRRLWKRSVLQIPVFLVLWVTEVFKIFLKKIRRF